MKAYVLLKVQMGQLEDVAASVRELPGVISADATFGVYDVIVVADVESTRHLGILVGHQIQCIPGVMLTCTCLTFE